MRELKSFSIAFLLLSLVVCVLAAPAVTENSDTGGSGAHEPAFSLIQVFDHLKFLEVKDKRTKETINFPAPVNAEVKLNGKPARLLDLRKGDDISLEFSNGELNSVNALRTTSGIMLDGDCKHVTFTSDYVDRKQLNISPTTIVELNGKQALLCDAKRGDSISIQADATGHVVKLDIVRKSPASLLWDNFRKNFLGRCFYFSCRFGHSTAKNRAGLSPCSLSRIHHLSADRHRLAWRRGTRLRELFIHCGTGHPAAGDTRGKPDIASGNFAGAHVRLQCNRRYSPVSLSGTADLDVLSCGEIANQEAGCNLE